MAHFYGVLRGTAKNDPTTRGHKSTGLQSYAAGWAGAIHTQLRHVDGRDEFRVVEIEWPSKSVRKVLIDWRRFGE